MDKEKVKVAILEIRKAIKAVIACGCDSECWIVKDMKFHIEELQNEIGGYGYEEHTGSR